MTALLALGLGLLAVAYSVWPVIRNAEPRRFVRRDTEQLVETNMLVESVRAWSSAAGEIETVDPDRYVTKPTRRSEDEKRK